MSALKPIAVRSFKNISDFLFETQTDNLNCEQVAAGYNGMIVDIAALRAESAGRLDALNSWQKLWAHICTVMGCADYLPSEQNFDAMLEKARATVAAERERADNAEYALKSEHGQFMAAQKKIMLLEQAGEALLKYRDANTLNFQLEKADDYIDKFRALIRSAHTATVTLVSAGDPSTMSNSCRCGEWPKASKWIHCPWCGELLDYGKP